MSSPFNYGTGDNLLNIEDYSEKQNIVDNQ